MNVWLALAAVFVGLVAVLAHGYLAERRAATRPRVPDDASGIASDTGPPASLGAVNAHLLAELEATHRLVPTSTQSDVDRCATQVRETFDAVGVDLANPDVVTALGLFVDTIDLLAEASAQRGRPGVTVTVTMGEWLEALALRVAVSAGRQVVLSSARGEIHRQVNP